MGVNTRKSSKASAPTQGTVPPWAEPIIRIADVIFPWCLAAGGLSLFVILTALLFGKTTENAPWLGTIVNTFAFFSVIGVGAMLAAMYSTLVPGWVGVIIGVVLLFGSKFAIIYLAGQGKVPDSATEYLDTLFATLPNVGVVLIAVSAIRLMIGFTLAFLYSNTRRDSKKYKYSSESPNAHEKPGLVPKCWQMSRCRPGVRNSCPNFIDRIPCWKRRSGCFCDKKLATFLVNSSERHDFTEADDMQRNMAAVDKSNQSAITGHMKNAARRPWIQQRKLCHECPLFLEHQEYKYRTWHWISFPLTLVIVGTLYTYFHMAYNLLAGFLDEFMKRLADMNKLPDNFRPDASSLEGSPFEWVLLFMVTLVLASYVVALVDKVFLDWKL